MCEVGIQSERVRTYLSSVAGDPLCVLERRSENIHDMFASVTSGSLPSVERLADLSPSLEQPVDLST